MNRQRKFRPWNGNKMLLLDEIGGFAIDLFLQKDMGRVLDGTIQKLEQIVIWCTNNEDELCRSF